MSSALDIQRRDGLVIGRFKAMASPCEVLIETADDALASELLQEARAEALRIEGKFSRYRDDNIMYRINNAGGEAVDVDDETARLLDFAAHCYAISDGLFDVTSGILRRAWTFDGSDRLPTQGQIEGLLRDIGWPRVGWQAPSLSLPASMEIDFGGIGKEYAVDRTLDRLRARCGDPVLVNFGGDLHCSGPRRGGEPWITGIENPLQEGRAFNTLQVYAGALATSGDAFRYLLKDGVRYGHILNPITGWPVVGAPRSVTVAAQNCTEAGILATLAMLHGPDAEVFLRAQDVRYWLFD
jgi:thiamine biosynthesis lipoprotein